MKLKLWRILIEIYNTKDNLEYNTTYTYFALSDLYVAMNKSKNVTRLPVVIAILSLLNQLTMVDIVLKKSFGIIYKIGGE